MTDTHTSTNQQHHPIESLFLLLWERGQLRQTQSIDLVGTTPLFLVDICIYTHHNHHDGNNRTNLQQHHQHQRITHHRSTT